MTEPVFTAEQVKADGRSRIQNTAGQSGVGAAVVTLGAAFCRWRGWLHGDLDVVGAGAWIVLASAATAALTNLSRLRGKQ